MVVVSDMFSRVAIEWQYISSDAPGRHYYVTRPPILDKHLRETLSPRTSAFQLSSLDVCANILSLKDAEGCWRLQIHLPKKFMNGSSHVNPRILRGWRKSLSQESRLHRLQRKVVHIRKRTHVLFSHGF